MNKKTSLWLILELVFLVAFNIVFFVLGGTKHPSSVWISYGFIHFSYIMTVVTPLLTRKSSSSALFGLSIYKISSTYFIAEFIIGMIIILLAPESYKGALAVQVTLTAVYAVILVSVLNANEKTADSIEIHEQEVSYIKNTASKVKVLINKASNKTSQKMLEKVYDAIDSSPTKSSNACAKIEKDIYDNICQLENSVYSDDDASVMATGKYIISLIDERNRILNNMN